MILVVDMNWKVDSLGFYEFVSPILSIAQESGECVVKHYLEVGEDEVRRYECVILSGTALKDHATLNHPEKFGWVRTCDKPVLGICAGMQTIGLAFGARLKKCLGIGMAEISTLKANPLFSSTFRAYTLHNYSVAPSFEFDVLAESGKCVQAIKHKQKPIYGVLFHPEARNKEVIKRFIPAFRSTEDLNTNTVKSNSLNI
jgi:GMP synthase (glutamine-hydrolysing)